MEVMESTSVSVGVWDIILRIISVLMFGFSFCLVFCKCLMSSFLCSLIFTFLPGTLEMYVLWVVSVIRGLRICWLFCLLFC